MKLYITTFFSSYNYGAFLQSFSLQKETLAEIINYAPTYRSALKRILNKRPTRIPYFIWLFLAVKSLRLYSKRFKEFEVL